ncbi:MAG: ABC transporter permease [Christensenellales bacterium]|jgi:putative aldouronate transport system permease protein
MMEAQRREGKHRSIAGLCYGISRELKRNYQLYLIILPPVIYLIIFHYIPMYGAQIAFRHFSAYGGIWGSPWAGLEHFINFFNSYQFERVLRNTLTISLYNLLASFPIPIILALLLNTLNNGPFKKTVQMVTYAPHFISTVVMAGIIVQFLSLEYGLANKIIRTLGGEGIMFMGEPSMFSSIYVWSGVWQEMGWSSIIYLSALSAIDVELHEAAIVDGAGRFKRILYIDIPGIIPTIVILFILNMGRLLNVGFEKVLLLQNTMNMEASEIISTYVYKVAFSASIPNFSYGTAIGLFNSVINFSLILIFNYISRRVGDVSLW